jgi:hypothetical protein
MVMANQEIQPELLADEKIQQELNRIRPELRGAIEAKLAEPGAERLEADDPAQAAVIDAAFRVEADKLEPLPIRWDRVERLQRSPVRRAKRFARHIGEKLLNQG